MSDDILTQEEIAAAAAEFRHATIDENTLLLEEVDGRSEYLVFDGEMAKLVERIDLTGAQEACKEAFKEPINRKSEFRRIASFPPEALRMWGRLNYGLTDSMWFLKREYSHLVLRAAHDRDFSQFRTAPGNYMRRA